MRSISLAAVLLLAAAAGNCKFSAHPKSGEQTCSNDNPPQCPDGYTCVTGICYDNSDLPATGGTGGGSNDSGAEGDVATCTPATIVCGTGPGKRCGEVSDPCTGNVNKCGACILGESCGATTHVCSIACGQASQPCCVGSRCTATDTACSNGQCVACGGVNQPCCTGDVCSAPNTTCADTTSNDTGKACLLACGIATAGCTSGQDQDCTLQCGPGKIGSTTCTCTANAWKCPACTFPAGTVYACYALPKPVPACEAAGLPTAGTTCALADCAPCGNATSKGFIDAGGTTRAGYCVCTKNQWNCALTKEWPCPGNPGC